MQRLMDTIRAILDSIRWVMKPVLIGGQWTMKAVQIVSAPVIRAADRVIDVADTVIGGVLSIPRRILGGFGRRGGGAAEQQADAQTQTDEQLRKAQAQQEAILTASQTARILQRAAKWRSEGRDVTDLIDALPEGLRTYTRKLTIAECIRLSELEPKVVVEWLSGARGRLPGIRTPEEVAFDSEEAKPLQSPVRGGSSAERQILDTLESRLRARTQQHDDDDDDDDETVVPMRRSI